MALPPQFESQAAFLRISRGLQSKGCAEGRAKWAARVALDEAPFAAPTDESWALACNRARHLAQTGVLEGDEGYGVTAT